MCFEELKHKNFFDDFVEKMSIICGKSGKENRLDVSYKLIDYFIDRNFLKICSWTGSTKEKDANCCKVALNYFNNFIKISLACWYIIVDWLRKLSIYDIIEKSAEKQYSKE